MSPDLPKGPINGNVQQPYVIMLVPACNEERHIYDTLESLNRQTRRPDETIVIINNSHDRTAAIASAMQPDFPGLKVLTMTENKHKKSGALNFALRDISLDDTVIIGEMDADTKVSLNIIEEALREFSNNSQLGGLCSRCGVKPFHECGERPPDAVPTKWEYLVWLAQAFEYGFTDATRATKSGRVKVMAGAFTLYRAQALRQVALRRQTNGDPIVFDPASEVEDYTLTLDVRAAGYLCLAGQHMWAETDVPIRLFGRGGLFAQRLRWYRGSTTEIIHRRLAPEIRHDVGWELVQLFGSLCKFAAFIAIPLLLLFSPGISFDWSKFSTIMLAGMVFLTWALYVPDLKYLRHIPKLTRLLSLTIIPTLLYGFWDDIIYYISYYHAITNRRGRW